MGKKLVCTLASSLILAVVGAASAAQSVGSLMDDVRAASQFDYCHWRFGEGADNEGLPDFESIIEDESGEVSKEKKRAAALVSSGTKIALAASNAQGCQRTFETAAAEHEKAYAKALKKLRKRAKMKFSKQPEIAEIQKKISDLWARDQAARSVYVASRGDSLEGVADWRQRLAGEQVGNQDAASTEYIRDLLTRYDWIDAHRFEDKVARHAWLLMQHADDHPDLQALALERMEKYLDNGGVRKRDYAYLWDRVAVNHDRKQRYATQPDWDCKDGKMALEPLEDPETVDERRAEMGLGPYQGDLDQMNRYACFQRK